MFFEKILYNAMFANQYIIWELLLCCSKVNTKTQLDVKCST